MTTPYETSPNPRRKLIIQILILVAALALLAWHARPDGRLHVVFLETKGDAALIETPDGRYVLLDGGGDPAALAAALGRRLPFWRRTLDMAILTLPDGKRLPGQVAALARYRAALVIAPPVAKPSALVREWLRLLDEQGTPVRAA